MDSMSRWLVGSSITSTLGFFRISLPNSMRPCSPPEITFTDFLISSLENSMRPRVPRTSCSPPWVHWAIQSNRVASSSKSSAWSWAK
ncbi:hypothetical protein D3C84_1018980 [compost metagenome]